MKHTFTWSVLVACISAAALEEHIEQRAVTCSASCTMALEMHYAVMWKPKTVTGTINGGNVIVSIDTDAGTTVTSTEYLLPSGVEMPPTNSLGSHIASTSVWVGSTKKLTTLTFPTQYISYAEGYSWHGTLSTDGVCSSVDSSSPVFVEYGTKYSWKGPEHISTMPPESLFENGPDPGGLLWTIIEGSAGYGPDPTKDGASTCTKTASQGFAILNTKQIVFNTMTVTGGSGSSSGETSAAYVPPTAAVAGQKTAAATGPRSTANDATQATGAIQATGAATEQAASQGAGTSLEVRFWLASSLAIVIYASSFW